MPRPIHTLEHTRHIPVKQRSRSPKVKELNRVRYILPNARQFLYFFTALRKPTVSSGHYRGKLPYCYRSSSPKSNRAKELAELAVICLSKPHPRRKPLDEYRKELRDRLSTSSLQKHLCNYPNISAGAALSPRKSTAVPGKPQQQRPSEVRKTRAQSA